MSRLTLGGNPAGQFPPCKDAALDAVFATAKPFDPGEVPIRVDGEEIFAPRADALVWALGELETHARLNRLADAELVPTGLRKRFHAIAAAADKLLKALKADRNAARFGVSEQIREGLKHFAEQDAREAGGFLNHQPESGSVIFEGEEITLTEFHEDRQLQDNIEGVFQISRWARQAEALARLEQKGRPGSTTSDQSYAVVGKGPQFDVCEELFEIWKNILGRPLRTFKTSTGTPSGPLIEFGTKCLSLLSHSKITPDGNEQRLKRYRAGVKPGL